MLMSMSASRLFVLSNRTCPTGTPCSSVAMSIRILSSPSFLVNHSRCSSPRNRRGRERGRSNLRFIGPFPQQSAVSFLHPPQTEVCILHCRNHAFWHRSHPPVSWPRPDIAALRSVEARSSFSWAAMFSGVTSWTAARMNRDALTIQLLRHRTSGFPPHRSAPRQTRESTSPNR